MRKKKIFFKKIIIWRNKKNLHENVVVVFCNNMSYNYKKNSLSGNKNNLLIKETYLE